MTVTQAIEFAEKKLNVDGIFRDAEALVDQINQLLDTQAGLETESRTLVTDLERMKSDIIERILLQSPEISVAAHERAVKLAMNNDAEYQSVIDRQNEVMAHRDAVSATVRGAENNLKLHVARIKQMGGYFEFLAIAKNGEITSDVMNSDRPF